MTVKHLRSMQRQQLALAAATDNTVVSKYRAGFTECAQEVTRYLGQVDGLTPDTRGRLMQHLGSCVQRMHHQEAAAQAPSHAQQLHLQMPAATPVSTLPGSHTTVSPQQALINAAASSMTSVNGVPVIPAFNLSQLPVVGGLVIPTNTLSLQQQQQQQHMQNVQNSCQYRDMNNNDVTPMPSLMGKHQATHDIAHTEPPRDYSSCRSSPATSPCSSSSSSAAGSPPSSSYHLQHHFTFRKSTSPGVTLPLAPKPVKLEPVSAAAPTAPAKVVVPQPQLGSVWRPWSASSGGAMLVH